MVLGLEWTAWLLLIAAVVPGFILAVLFYRAHGGEGNHSGGQSMEESE